MGNGLRLMLRLEMVQKLGLMQRLELKLRLPLNSKLVMTSADDVNVWEDWDTGDCVAGIGVEPAGAVDGAPGEVPGKRWRRHACRSSGSRCLARLEI